MLSEMIYAIVVLFHYWFEWRELFLSLSFDDGSEDASGEFSEEFYCKKKSWNVSFKTHFLLWTLKLFFWTTNQPRKGPSSLTTGNKKEAKANNGGIQWKQQQHDRKKWQ